MIHDTSDKRPLGNAGQTGTALTLALAAIAIISGCGSPDVGRHSWEIMFTDATGHLKTVAVSSDDLFMGSPSVDITPIRTLGKCCSGWKHPDTGMIATLEEEDGSYAIRLYDASMTLLGEHTEATWEAGRYGGDPSMPVVDERGYVAFVDIDGSLSIGRIAEGKMKIDHVCRLDVRSRTFPFWLSKDEIALELRDGVYLVNIHSGKKKFVRKGRLLGVISGHLVTATRKGVEFVDSAGGVRCPTPGQRRLRLGQWPRAYPGAHFYRLSPDGEFIAYDSTTFWGSPAVIFYHLESGTEAELIKEEVGGASSCGSWNEVS